MGEPIAYLNGRYVPVSEASLHVFDLGVVGGASVTEMARTFRHVPFLLDEHLARLARSLDAVGFQIDLTISDLDRICHEVITRNAKLIPPEHDLGLIIFVTAGQNLTYVGRTGRSTSARPTVCAHTFPLPFELWSDLYETGIHLVTVETQSIPARVIDPRIKHRSRLHWHLASKEARQVDSQAMAILSDAEGQLTETATGNLCVLDGSTIYTPASRVLKGISSEFLSQIAASSGIGFVHGPVASDNLARADEAFITSTPNCMLPVTRFNGRPIGSGAPGPVYRQLIRAWSERVGVDLVQQMRQGAMDRLRTGEQS